MVGRRLNDDEVDSYDMVTPDLARRIRLVNIPFIPGGYAGMTLGRTVLLAREVDNDGGSALIAHELVHARQWTEQGAPRFLSAYLTSFAKNLYQHRRWKMAYHNIDAELEAKKETTDWLRRRSRDSLADDL